jgi:hypothetical protein
VFVYLPVISGLPANRAESPKNSLSGLTVSKSLGNGSLFTQRKSAQIDRLCYSNLIQEKQSAQEGIS